MTSCQLASFSPPSVQGPAGIVPSVGHHGWPAISFAAVHGRDSGEQTPLFERIRGEERFFPLFSPPGAQGPASIVPSTSHHGWPAISFADMHERDSGKQYSLFERRRGEERFFSILTPSPTSPSTRMPGS
ncbi:hypothetical protein COCNU_02G008030 [Cocos nucifera]|uniref:Uncharacterized protein n=1 Tax=Cocos nucifera TaxID=13894 RepID=A0A8K0HZ52_COCNU|nr:hypothetical protein COCNU_02G008030 [Cocos nucifera]